MNCFAKPVAAFLLFASSLVWAQIPPDVTLDSVSGVSGFSGALSLKNAGDGSNRLFIVQQNGIIRVVDGSGQLLLTRFVDISDDGSNLVTTSASERGLLDIAFHPEFAVNGLFYLHYSDNTDCNIDIDEPPCGDTVVAEFSVTADPNVASNTPTRIILTVTQDFGNHNGGGMNFGPDGYLYLGLGDGGSGNDPCNRSLTLDPADIISGGSCESDQSVALLGKMLRIDVDTEGVVANDNFCGNFVSSGGLAPYAIPDENPFDGMSNRCGEVLLYGLRNPWRSSFDRLTGDLWIGDVGQNSTEEISFLEWPLAGDDNLGWKTCEGSTLRGSSTTPCENELPNSILPVIEYPTGLTFGRSITGGYRYRGPVTSLFGQYIFGDAVTGRIWFATESGGNWSFEQFGSSVGSVRSFGEDEQGNLYVVTGNDILRFNGDFAIFADGFES